VSYLKNADNFKAAPDVVKRRRAQFEALNEIVTEGGGWLTSTPGNREVVVECLPGSRLPDLLADRGYDLKPEQDGERILPVAVSQKMTRNADGTLGPVTEGSTQAVTTVFTAPGIAKVKRYAFEIPKR
jgi:hypothetical protein